MMDDAERLDFDGDRRSSTYWWMRFVLLVEHYWFRALRDDSQ